MSIPPPRIGMVIRYSFLFSDGREKERPAAIVVALEVGDGRHRVLVMPITHAPPRDPAAALEIPTRLKRHLGLDDDRSWIVLDELNDFIWPSPELLKTPGGDWEYGQLPPGFHKQIKDRAGALARKVRRRDE